MLDRPLCGLGQVFSAAPSSIVSALRASQSVPNLSIRTGADTVGLVRTSLRLAARQQRLAHGLQSSSAGQRFHGKILVPSTQFSSSLRPFLTGFGPAGSSSSQLPFLTQSATNAGANRNAFPALGVTTVTSPLASSRLLNSLGSLAGTTQQ